jgi:hypothetical protein
MALLGSSLRTLHSFANGYKPFPDKRIDVFCDGATIQLDSFRKMNGYGRSTFEIMNLCCQDKGNAARVAAFVGSMKLGMDSPSIFDERI